MPLPGHQHQTVANPFEERRQHVSEYTAEEIALLQHRLEKKLGPEYISARPGPSGQQVHYIGAEKVIQLANDVFGFNGWSSSIQNIQVDYADENPTTGRINLGISVVVRVTLRDGTFHEDIGYGTMENCKGKGAAFEKAKKEATTDAMKRALRHFGNVMGNCIYDKEYVKKVTKIKPGPAKGFSVESLHRHSDFVERKADFCSELGAQALPTAMAAAAMTTMTTAAPSAQTTTGPSAQGASEQQKTEEVKEEMPKGRMAVDSFEDFLGGMDDFDEADFNVHDGEDPDGVVISTGSSEKPLNQSAKAPPPSVTVNTPRPSAAAAAAGSRNSQTPNQQQQPPRPPPQPQAQDPPQRPQGPPLNPSINRPPPAGRVPESVGWFSARAVKDQPNGDTGFAPQPNQAFNPHAESPSIRKTPGIDHRHSRPVGRNGQHVDPQTTSNSTTTTTAPEAAGGSTAGFQPHKPAGAPSAGTGAPISRANVLNPQLDQARRIGTPSVGTSPLANRNQYKPPTMKRPFPDGGNNAATRPALTEVSTNGATTSTALGGGTEEGDPKRQKVA